MLLNDDFEIALSLNTEEGFNNYLTDKTKEELKELLQIFETFEEYEKRAVIKRKIDA